VKKAIGQISDEFVGLLIVLFIVIGEPVKALNTNTSYRIAHEAGRYGLRFAAPHFGREWPETVAPTGRARVRYQGPSCRADLLQSRQKLTRSGH